MQKKYLSIYEDLANKIKINEWQASSMLPSEHELAATYHTSRETIRKALNLLAQNGFIQKIRGKGSVVIDQRKLSFPVSGIVSFKELSDRLNLSSKTYVEQLDYVSSEQNINKIFDEEHYQLWKTIRVREIDKQKVILDKDYFNERYVPILPKEICENSIYNHIENELDLRISFAQKEIMVEEPTEEDNDYLDMVGYSSIVVIRSHVYLEDASLFQYTESRHRPDKFQFTDFARRLNN